MWAGTTELSRKGFMELEPDKAEEGRKCFQATPGRKFFFQLLNEETLEIYVETLLFRAFIHLLRHFVFIAYLLRASYFLCAGTRNGQGR